MDLKILEIASNTDNNKNITNHTHHSKLKNPLCGDEIEIKLIMKNEKLVDFSVWQNTGINKLTLEDRKKRYSLGTVYSQPVSVDGVCFLMTISNKNGHSDVFVKCLNLFFADV